MQRRSRHNSSNQADLALSRYATDFTEMGRLGKGGFGEVVKGEKVDNARVPDQLTLRLFH